MKFLERFKSDCSQLSLTCREAARAQSDQLDQPLRWSTRVGLSLHLLICRWCRRYGSQIRFLRHAAHDHPEKFTETAPQTLSAEARGRLKQRLQSEK